MKIDKLGYYKTLNFGVARILYIIPEEYDNVKYPVVGIDSWGYARHWNKDGEMLNDETNHGIKGSQIGNLVEYLFDGKPLEN